MWCCSQMQCTDNLPGSARDFRVIMELVPCLASSVVSLRHRPGSAVFFLLFSPECRVLITDACHCGVFSYYHLLFGDRRPLHHGHHLSACCILDALRAHRPSEKCRKRVRENALDLRNDETVFTRRQIDQSDTSIY